MSTSTHLSDSSYKRVDISRLFRELTNKQDIIQLLKQNKYNEGTYIDDDNYNILKQLLLPFININAIIDEIETLLRKEKNIDNWIRTLTYLNIDSIYLEFIASRNIPYSLNELYNLFHNYIHLEYDMRKGILMKLDDAGDVQESNGIIIREFEDIETINAGTSIEKLWTHIYLLYNAKLYNRYDITCLLARMFIDQIKQYQKNKSNIIARQLLTTKFTELPADRIMQFVGDKLPNFYK